MTFRDVVRAMLCRWYVCVGILALATALTASLWNLGNLYTTKTVVAFTVSSASSLQPDNGTLDSNVIDFASAIANEINDDQHSPRYASADAPYYGAGIRRGIMITLPNNGGQWAPTSFTSAVIDIQIVGPDPTWVRAQQTVLLDRIESKTREQQSTAPPSRRIDATVEPLTTQILEVAPSKMNELAAVVAMGLAILIFSAWLAIMVDRLGRHGHHQPHGARPTSQPEWNLG